MSDLNQQLANAFSNLKSIDQKAVPRANVMAINRITARILSHSIRDTSKAAKVQNKIIRRYARITRKASVAQQNAWIRVRRSDIPAIHITTARNQISRNNAKHKARKAKSKRRYSTIRAGKHVFQNAFLTRLKNGKWHIMQRTSGNRYPIKMVAVSIKNEITESFKNNSQKLMQTDMPKELASAIGQQVKLVVKRQFKQSIRNSYANK